MEDKDLKKYAEGWVTEKPDSPVPGFLRIAFTVVGLGCVSYFILYMNGETDHPDRGRLVKDFNNATVPADSLMYLIAALALLYVLSVLVFVFRSGHKE